MVIDTSALIAMLTEEPEHHRMKQALARDPSRSVSAVTVFEAAVVVESRLGQDAGHDLDRLLLEADCRVVAVDAALAERARVAWRRFGKGRHPAALNFGDCFPYALATTTSEPLLFKGDDFSKTDVVPVEY